MNTLTNDQCELKPCPFCMGAPHKTHEYAGDRAAAVCLTPLCALFNIMFEIEQWNTRADLAQDTEEDIETAAAIAANKQMALTYFNALWQGIENHIGVDPDCAHWPDVIRSAIASQSRPAPETLTEESREILSHALYVGTPKVSHQHILLVLDSLNALGYRILKEEE